MLYIYDIEHLLLVISIVSFAGRVPDCSCIYISIYVNLFIY